MPSKPGTSKILIVYLSVSIEAISDIPVQEENNELRSVYFVSQMLQDQETQYQVMEKVAWALVTTAQRLQQYSQSHGINVRIGCLITKML